MYDSSKRIFINYRCGPACNVGLTFIFWLIFSFAAVISMYLFLMYVIDTTIKQDQMIPNARPGNPSHYGNIVENNLKPLPIIGDKLYP